MSIKIFAKGKIENLLKGYLAIQIRIIEDNITSPNRAYLASCLWHFAQTPPSRNFRYAQPLGEISSELGIVVHHTGYDDKGA